MTRYDLTRLFITRVMFLLVLASMVACAYDKKKIIENKISAPVTLYEGLYLGSLLDKQENIKSVIEAVAALDKTWYSNIGVIKPGSELAAKTVNNCQDYFDATKRGMQPVREYERSAYYEFSIMCIAAKNMAKASPAVSTFLNNFVLDEKSPEILPKQFAMVISEKENEEMLKNSQLETWADVNKISDVKKNSSSSATFKIQGAQQRLDFVAKADFNDDKVEDLLITLKDTVIDGSYSAIRMFLITKYSSEGDFVLLKEYNPY